MARKFMQRHYIEVARVIAREVERARSDTALRQFGVEATTGALGACESIAAEFERVFAAESCKFDKRRFRRACGIQDADDE